MKFYVRMYANKCKGACKVVHVRIRVNKYQGRNEPIKNRLHNSFKREKKLWIFHETFSKRLHFYQLSHIFLINNNPRIS